MYESPHDTAHKYIDKVAELSVPYGQKKPDEKTVGREAYAFSPQENDLFDFTRRKAHAIMRGSGLECNEYRIDIDEVGNIFVTILGDKHPDEIVMAESHLDSVLNGGKYDGVAGVASAMAYLEQAAQSKRMPRGFMAAAFRAEESSPMTGDACLGSKIATGAISEERLQAIGYGMPDGEKQSLQDLFGQERWARILQQRENPWISDGIITLPEKPLLGKKGHMQMKIIGAHELHIEQSSGLRDRDCDAGIVTHIGGSGRLELSLDASHLPYSTTDTSNAPRARFDISFLGVGAHTGGTPPNRTENKSESGRWYRRDALVAAADFLLKLLEQHPCIEVSAVFAPRPLTGFTTIPAKQNIILHVPIGKVEYMEHSINKLAAECMSLKEVKCTADHSIERRMSLPTLDRQALMTLLRIPLVVERESRLTAQKASTIFGVRATSTDATYTTNGVTMKLDQRMISEDDRAILHGNIVKGLRDEGIPVDELIAREPTVTPAIKLDSNIVALASYLAERKGLKTERMPSFPGHDIAMLANAHVPSGMVFAAHNGESHCPQEKIGQRALDAAIGLQHAILDDQTKRVP